MTRRQIIQCILAEASGQSFDEAAVLLDAMLKEGVLGSDGLEVSFSIEEAGRLLEEFREELPGIRRWLIELGLLPESGHA